jgi:hypothetical protein
MIKLLLLHNMHTIQRELIAKLKPEESQELVKLLEMNEKILASLVEPEDRQILDRLKAGDDDLSRYL